MGKTIKRLCAVFMLCLAFTALSVGAFDVYAKKNFALTLENAEKGVSLSWKASKGDSFGIYRKTGTGKYEKIKTVSSNKYTDSSVTSGTKYGYYVKKAKKPRSKIVSTVYLSAPEFEKLSRKEDALELSWKAVEGAEHYNIYRRQEGKKTEYVTTVKELTYTDEKIEKDTKYTYTVRAIKGSYRSAPMKEVSGALLASPEAPVITGKDTGLGLKWAEVKGADKYVVYRKLSTEENYKSIATVKDKKTSYTDKKVTDGLTYDYYIKAVTGKIGASDAEKFTQQLYIACPSDFSIRQKDKTVTLKWKKTATATKYELEKRVSDGEWKLLKELSADKESYKEKLSTLGKKNEYRIRTVTEQGVSGYSMAISTRFVDPKKPMVALTYDDGPHAKHTKTILNVLEKYNVRATFFVIGVNISGKGNLLKRQTELGCEVGNHSYSHVIYSSSSSKTIKSQISKTDNLIKKYTGKTPTLARAPGGSIGKASKIVNKPFIQWSVDTLDWKYRSKDRIVSYIKKNVRDGSIILMHDAYKSTADASKEIIPWLIKKGYQLVTVSEMMEARGINMKNGKSYNNAYKKNK